MNFHVISKKKSGEFTNYQVPNLYNISGSAHWFNIADNGITVYRYYDEDGESETQVYIQKVKHRFIGKIGRVNYRFNLACSRFEVAGFKLTDPVTGEHYTF